MNFNSVAAKLRKPILFGLLGAAGCFLGQLIAEAWQAAIGIRPVLEWFDRTFGGDVQNERLVYNLLRTPVATAFTAMGFCLLLMVGQNLYLRRGIASVWQVATAVLGGLLSGWVAGFLAEIIFQIVLRAVSNALVIEVVRVIAWTVFGVATAAGVSLVVPNLRLTRALIGGVVGGIMGAIAFIVVLHVLGWFSLGTFAEIAARLIGMPTIGLCIGAMIALAEMLLSSANLEVGYGAAFTDSRIIPLGASPVRVGSSRERCAVYRKDLAPIALEYRIEGGKILLQDGVTGATQTITPGHSLQIGTLILRIAGGTGAPVVASPAPVAAPPAAVPVVQRSQAVASPSAAVLRLRRNDGQTVVVVEGTPLTNHDILRPGMPNASFAELARNPKDPTMLGLKNVSGVEWQVWSPQGTVNTLPVGRSARVAAGTTIDQGGVRLTMI